MTELPQQDLRLLKYRLRVGVRRDEWTQAGFEQRLARKDPTLWSEGAVEEVESRLGWLDLPGDGLALVDQVEEFAARVRRAGMKRVFLVGMGGSSLAPEIFEKTFNRAGGGYVQVLDSTHPDSVRQAVDRVESDKYFFIVSSKSGSTLETRAIFQATWHAMERWLARPGSHFVAITDAGSLLEHVANRLHFERVFTAPSNVGGRFSALSYFGLLPAALSGVRVERLLERARAMRDTLESPESPAVTLGAALGELALAGRDKLTFAASPGIASFLSWLEQLIAESLGKNGKGIVPVVGEPLGGAESYGEDRTFVGLLLEGEERGIGDKLDELHAAGHPVIRIALRDRYDLGAEIVRWEIAVAAAAAVLEVQPFDQPNVELTKELTRGLLDESGPSGPTQAPPEHDGRPGPRLQGALGEWLALVERGDYFAIQAFLAADEKTDRALARLQAALRERTGCAATAGYGPRYLHSTGQLHKGGPDRGLFLQLTAQPGSDILVPKETYSFATLLQAQADGDAAALSELGRRLLRVRLPGEPVEAVSRLVDLVSA